MRRMAIKRRTFLKSAGSMLALAPLGSIARARNPGLSVGIVGGGIIGAAIAMHLAKAGADVKLFEKTAPAAGATGKSFAWINAYNSDPHYRALRLRSISDWRELDKSLPLDVHWGGCLHWAESLAEAEILKAEMDEFDRTGYPAQMMDHDRLADIAPGLRLDNAHAVAFNALDAHVDPVHVTRVFLDEATRLGAKVVYPSEVLEIRPQGNGLGGITTTTGSVDLDRLVIAGGTDTPALAAQAGYAPALKHAPGILLHTKPAGPAVSQVVEAPHMYFKQYRDGRIVGNDAAHPPVIPEHAGILEGPMDMPEDIRKLHGERILAAVQRKLRGVQNATYDRLTLGYRPMPVDGLPVVGYSPDNADIYIAVMHSGVTLAPIMGRLIAREIVANETIDRLAPYRPGRS